MSHDRERSMVKLMEAANKRGGFGGSAIYGVCTGSAYASLLSGNLNFGDFGVRFM